MAKILIFLACLDARVIQTQKMSVVRAIPFAILILLENDPIVLHGMTMWKESKMQDPNAPVLCSTYNCCLVPIAKSHPD